MTRPRRVLLYIQHLLGVGHLKRALLIAEALGDAGITVWVVSGGTPARVLEAHDVDVVQLPAIRAGDARFSTLVDSDGKPVDDVFKANRRDRLLELFGSFAPDALVIEAFPFGRRQLRFELIPLLEEADRTRPRPRILCSVRDIVQEKRDPARLDEQVATIRRFFDQVLVHGDPNLVRLEESFSRTGEIADRIAYTGYVCGTVPHRRDNACDTVGEVLVSVGGGAVGSDLLRVALAARVRSKPSRKRWRLLVGDSVSAGVFERLSDSASENVIVERSRADFDKLLANCAVSVSQCGYNTMMDVLRYGVPSVVVPFRGAGETEQALRAEKLRSRGLVHVVDERTLSPDRLATAIDAAIQAGRPVEHGLDLGGGQRTAQLIAASLGIDR